MHLFLCPAVHRLNQVDLSRVVTVMNRQPVSSLHGRPSAATRLCMAQDGAHVCNCLDELFVLFCQQRSVFLPLFARQRIGCLEPVASLERKTAAASGTQFQSQRVFPVSTMNNDISNRTFCVGRTRARNSSVVPPRPNLARFF